MSSNNLGSFTSRRDLATLGVFAVLFAALLLFRMNIWVVALIAALFIGYLSWASTAFLVTQQNFTGRTFTAWALPVGMAAFKVLLCLGVVWLVVGSARHLFGF